MILQEKIRKRATAAEERLRALQNIVAENQPLAAGASTAEILEAWNHKEPLIKAAIEGVDRSLPRLGGLGLRLVVPGE